LEVVVADVDAFIHPSFHTPKQFSPNFTPISQHILKMSDNTIVKGVAGTCITFSFILAGKSRLP